MLPTPVTTAPVVTCSYDGRVRVPWLTPPGTACWPCRQRKVKCDNKQPCENCVKREHPQLCSYKPNRSNAAKQGSLEHTLNRKRPHSPVDDHERVRERTGSSSDRQPNDWPRAMGMCSRRPDDAPCECV